MYVFMHVYLCIRECMLVERDRMPDSQSEEPELGIPFAIISKCGHFCSLHDAPVISAVSMSAWL